MLVTACTGHGGQMEVPFPARFGWASSLGVRSLAATSGLVSQCPFILETEVGNPEVGTGLRWRFSGAGRGSSAFPLPLLSALTCLEPEFGTQTRRGHYVDRTRTQRKTERVRPLGRGGGSGPLGARHGAGERVVGEIRASLRVSLCLCLHLFVSLLSRFRPPAPHPQHPSSLPRVCVPDPSLCWHGCLAPPTLPGHPAL